MSTFVAISVPAFALQAVLRHTPELRDRPVALIPEETPKARIVEATAPAHAAGVQRGMTPSQALARCPGLVIKTRSPAAERSARAAVLEVALNLSPFIEDTAAGICTVQLLDRGQTSVGEDKLAAILARLTALNLHARVGVAPNAELALLAAASCNEMSPWRLVRDTSELADLPVETLAPPPALHEILRKWGIHTLGAFTALGREQLVERLGADVLPLFERAAGRIERPLQCITPAECFEESIEFEHEIETLEPLLFMLRRFLEQLALRLDAVHLVAAEVWLRLGFTSGEPSERTFKVPSPTCDVDVLFRMLHTHLESFTADHPIISLELTATPARPTRQQFSLFESALRDPNQFYETLARLGALLGPDRVGTPELESSHRPDAVRLVPADFTRAPRRADAAALPLGLTLRRFRPPLPASTCEKADLTSESTASPRPLSYLTSSFISGEITAAYGPMVTSGDWWNERAWSRREWDVQINRELLCRLFELENGEWFLEGVYD